MSNKYANFEPEYQEALDDLIEQWEPHNGECIRSIDITPDTVERIIKVQRPLGTDPRAIESRYTLYRYFLIGSQWQVSVDLESVDADRMIQEMAERVQ